MDNPRSERVRRVASLASRAGRKKHRQFLAEGPQVAREALTLWLSRFEPQPPPGTAGQSRADGLPELDSLFFDPVALRRLPDVEALVDRLRAVLFDPAAELPRGARPFLREATPEVLAAMGDAETSQGLVMVARIPSCSSEPAAAHQLNAAALVATLVRVQDPGNVGTMIRTADAAGADMVVLSGGAADPWAPKVVRAAAGSHFHIPLITGADPEPLAHRSKAVGMQVLATAAEAESQLTQLVPAAEQTGSFDAAARTMWLFGNEAQGLSQQELQLADHVVAIPIYGRAESLNVATAATICLYSSALAQRASAVISAAPRAPGHDPESSP